MIITFEWLRDYIKTDLTSNEIIEHLENLGFNLKIEYLNIDLWDQIEIVKIIDKKDHPNADKLKLYTITKKNGEKLELVCGDQELEINNYVPYAKPGITMPNGTTLKISKIRGIDSNGMLCSASEIELPIETTKVLRCFSEDWGKTMKEAYDKEGIFEIELTPNRGDALSIRGIARILANENLGEFIDYNPIIKYAEEKEFFKIESNRCKGLYCVLFKHDISETPAKIAKRLQLTNHTVTNLDIVDYTNYISHDIGQPMHAFDYDKLEGKDCKLTELTENQNYITLSGKEVELKKGSLVFKANENIISWSSIIGGDNSKVDNNTKTILLETGVFSDIDSIQRRNLGIYTSASKKAEYGTDPTIIEYAAHKLLSLSNSEPLNIQHHKFEEIKKINFRFSKIKEIIGINISEQEFKKIMNKRGFKINLDGTISPPGYKFFDVNTENCIIEELATSLYQNLESKNLSPRYVKNVIKENRLAKISLACGFNESRNISLGAKESELFNLSENKRRVINYSNLNYSILRGSLIPDLLKNLSWSINNKYKITKFFEQGLIYGEKFINNQKTIFTAISIKQDELRSLLTKIFSEYDILEKIQTKSVELDYSSNSCEFYCDNIKIATISTLKQDLLKAYNIQECYVLEILEKEISETTSNKTIFIENSPIYKDITITLNPNIKAAKIINYLNENNYDFKILSVYPENNLNKSRNITLQFKIYEPNSLTKDEINERINLITEQINKLISN